MQTPPRGVPWVMRTSAGTVYPRDRIGNPGCLRIRGGSHPHTEKTVTGIARLTETHQYTEVRSPPESVAGKVGSNAGTSLVMCVQWARYRVADSWGITPKVRTPDSLKTLHQGTYVITSSKSPIRPSGRHVLTDMCGWFRACHSPSSVPRH